MRKTRINSSRFDKRWLLIIVLSVVVFVSILFAFSNKISFSPSKTPMPNCLTDLQSQASFASSIPPPSITPRPIDETVAGYASTHPQTSRGNCMGTVNSWMVFALTNRVVDPNNLQPDRDSDRWRSEKEFMMLANGVNYKIYKVVGGTVPGIGNVIADPDVVSVLCDLYANGHLIELGVYFNYVEGHSYYLFYIDCDTGGTSVVTLINPNKPNQFLHLFIESSGVLVDGDGNVFGTIRYFGVA